VFYILFLFSSLYVPFFFRLISYNGLEAIEKRDSHNLENAILNREKVVTIRLIIRNMGETISGTIFFFKAILK